MTIKDIPESVLKGILKELKSGMWERDAGAMNGVPESTYYRWKRDIPLFKKYTEDAILKYKKGLISAVNVNTIRSGKLAIEVLRRRWPKEWNIAKKIQIEDPDQEFGKMLRVLFGKPNEGDIENDKPIGLPEVS